MIDRRSALYKCVVETLRVPVCFGGGGRGRWRSDVSEEVEIRKSVARPSHVCVCLCVCVFLFFHFFAVSLSLSLSQRRRRDARKKVRRIGEWRDRERSTGARRRQGKMWFSSFSFFFSFLFSPFVFFFLVPRSASFSQQSRGHCPHTRAPRKYTLSRENVWRDLISFSFFFFYRYRTIWQLSAASAIIRAPWRSMNSHKRKKTKETVIDIRRRNLEAIERKGNSFSFFFFF